MRDFDAFCAQADDLADELLAALEDLCKGIDNHCIMFV